MKSVRTVITALVLCMFCAGVGYWVGISEPHDQDNCPEVIDIMIMDTGGTMSRVLRILSLLENDEVERAKGNLRSYLSVNVMFAQRLMDEHPSSLKRNTVLPICEKAKQYLQEPTEKESQQGN